MLNLFRNSAFYYSEALFLLSTESYSSIINIPLHYIVKNIGKSITCFAKIFIFFAFLPDLQQLAQRGWRDDKRFCTLQDTLGIKYTIGYGWIKFGNLIGIVRVRR